MNFHSFFFLSFALVACVFGLAVVMTSNVVRMAFYLVVSLGATAGLFFLAGADFLGAMQLLIYVGGTLVLLVFGVMLTAQGPFVSMKTRGGEWILAAIVGGSLFALLLHTISGVESWRSPGQEVVEAREKLVTGVTSAPIGGGLLGYRVDQIERAAQEQRDPTLPKIARGMAGYLLPFEIISLHLLIVLVGAAYLARPKKRAGAEEE
ncbi:MAG: NADH-quinone oxidoreductase subunit J [Pirellulales bacterium]